MDVPSKTSSEAVGVAAIDFARVLPPALRVVESFLWYYDVPCVGHSSRPWQQFTLPCTG